MTAAADSEPVLHVDGDKWSASYVEGLWLPSTVPSAADDTLRLRFALMKQAAWHAIWAMSARPEIGTGKEAPSTWGTRRRPELYQVNIAEATADRVTITITRCSREGL